MSWLNEHSVIYQVFIDRFALPSSDERALKDVPDDKPVFCGGNIRGIIEHFDHIKKLNVSALWISPFYKGVAFHGYHTTDLFAVDAHFGTEADLKELIDLAHQNGLKIVVDFVPNHVSKEHPYFLDAQASKKSPYRNWFYFSDWSNTYLCFLDVRDLPKLNLDYGPARKHVIDAARKWLMLGFDGFRLDHIPGPSNDFWNEFLTTLRSEFPDAEFFGEAWMFNIKFSQLKTLRVTHKYLAWLFGTPFLMRQYYGLFPSLLDFDFNIEIRSYVSGEITRPELEQRISKHFRSTRKTQMLTFLDNHDMDRFLFTTGNNMEKLKEVAAYQFAQTHPVVIYQGTEFAMTHERSMASYSSYGDLIARKMIPWEQGDGSLFDFYSELIKRKSN